MLNDSVNISKRTHHTNKARRRTWPHGCNVEDLQLLCGRFSFRCPVRSDRLFKLPGKVPVLVGRPCCS